MSSLRYAQGQALSAAKHLASLPQRSKARAKTPALREAKDDMQETSQARSREAFSPNI
jgi:hypothetical protein